jgi:hypothetical protein
MSEGSDRKITPSRGGGIFQGLATQIKLIVRLMGDKRVNPLLKLLPLGSLVYLVVPDLVPGPLDDAAILWLGTYLFVELCPPDVVQEHLKSLSRDVISEIRDKPLDDEDIVDAEFWEQDEQKKDNN